MSASDKVAKATNVVKNMSLDELLAALGRYCGPHNQLLCDKTFDCILPTKLVNDEIASRMFDELLSEET